MGNVTEHTEMEEKMAREEELRKKEAEAMKTNLENQKKQQGNAITEMFDRLKTENEQRKHEIHGLKDILVRENDNRARETDELRMAMELGTQQLAESIEKEKQDCKKRIKTLETDFEDGLKKTKKD